MMPLYPTGDQTAADLPDHTTMPGSDVTVRPLTESSIARTELYEVADSTGPSAWAKTSFRRGVSRVRRHRQKEVSPAAVEHIGRLLRLCQDLSQELVSTSDPLQAGLLGGQLLGVLNEMWTYREDRENDWIEMLNLIQLLLAKQEFEALSGAQRRALATVFKDDISTQPAGRADVERMLQRLTTTGFDVWRGIAQVEIGE